MTFLGANTVSDTQQLMDDIDFRFGKVDELFHRVMNPLPFGMAMTGKDADTIKANWAILKKAWEDTKSSIGHKLIFLRFTNPLPVDKTAVSPTDYNQVRGFVEMDSGDPNIHPMDSLRGIQLFLEGVSDIKLDLDTGRPVQGGTSSQDFDNKFLASPTIQGLAGAGQVVVETGGAIGGAIKKSVEDPTNHTIRNIGIGVAAVVLGVLGIKIFK